VCGDFTVCVFFLFWRELRDIWIGDCILGIK
jgi:hypothetical protein